MMQILNYARQWTLLSCFDSNAKQKMSWWQLLQHLLCCFMNTFINIPTDMPVELWHTCTMKKLNFQSCDSLWLVIVALWSWWHDCIHLTNAPQGSLFRMLKKRTACVLMYRCSTAQCPSPILQWNENSMLMLCCIRGNCKFVLNINSVVEALVHFHSTGDWGSALDCAIPERKKRIYSADRDGGEQLPNKRRQEVCLWDVLNTMNVPNASHIAHNGIITFDSELGWCQLPGSAFNSQSWMACGQSSKIAADTRCRSGQMCCWLFVHDMTIPRLM